MHELLDVSLVVAYHDEHLGRSPALRRARRTDQRLWHAIEADHLCNSLLWDEEDKARRRDAPAGEIARCKRLIDGYNQRRSDALETIDELLLAALADLGPPHDDARLSSETAGSMIDRLSVLALRMHHMGLEIARTEAGSDHVARCRSRLAVLREQRADLADCLERLMRDCVHGNACFKVYRQFKIYNEPALDPWLHRRGGATSPAAQQTH